MKPINQQAEYSYTDSFTLFQGSKDIPNGITINAGTIITPIYDNVVWESSDMRFWDPITNTIKHHFLSLSEYLSSPSRSKFLMYTGMYKYDPTPDDQDQDQMFPNSSLLFLHESSLIILTEFELYCYYTDNAITLPKANPSTIISSHIEEK